MATSQPANVAWECVVKLMTGAPCRVSPAALMRACHERATEGQFGAQKSPAEEWTSKFSRSKFR